MIVEGPVSWKDNCHMWTRLITSERSWGIGCLGMASSSGSLGSLLAAESRAEWNTELFEKRVSTLLDS